MIVRKIVNEDYDAAREIYKLGIDETAIRRLSLSITGILFSFIHVAG